MYSQLIIKDAPCTMSFEDEMIKALALKENKNRRQLGYDVSTELDTKQVALYKFLPT